MACARLPGRKSWPCDVMIVATASTPPIGRSSWQDVIAGAVNSGQCPAPWGEAGSMAGQGRLRDRGRGADPATVPRPRRHRRRAPACMPRLANEIGLRIVRGDYPPGTILPNEAKVVGDLRGQPFGGARSHQDADGKEPLSSRPKIGSWVEPRERWNLLDRDVLGWYAMSPDREQFLRTVQEFRHIIEPEATALARNAPHRRADGRDQRRLPRHGRGDDLPSAPRPTRDFTWPSCALPATIFWCRSAC